MSNTYSSETSTGSKSELKADKDTVQTMVEKKKVDVQVLDRNVRKEMLKKYKKEPTVQVFLSPLYKPYLGNVMAVSVNGISVYIKVDGSVHEIPKTFADIVNERRIYLDSIISKSSQMSNVSENLETTPGELPLI